MIKIKIFCSRSFSVLCDCNVILKLNFYKKKKEKRTTEIIAFLNKEINWLKFHFQFSFVFTKIRWWYRWFLFWQQLLHCTVETAKKEPLFWEQENSMIFPIVLCLPKGTLSLFQTAYQSQWSETFDYRSRSDPDVWVRNTYVSVSEYLFMWSWRSCKQDLKEWEVLPAPPFHQTVVPIAETVVPQTKTCIQYILMCVFKSTSSSCHKSYCLVHSS